MHQFFQQFTVNQPQEVMVDSNTPELRHNLLVLEMYNNWPFVRCLMLKHRENRLKQIDAMENEWLNYILQNNIDVEAHKDKEEFLNGNLKKLSQ
jgi:hypothetical protein